MTSLDLPPKLWLPERPAIIRPVAEIDKYFPVAIGHTERRAVASELVKSGRLELGAIPFGMFSVGALPFALSYGSFGSVNPGGGTSFTVSSLAIGAAPVAPNRRYVYAAIGLASSGTFTVSTVTIGGNAASLFAGLNASSFVQAQIWVAEVPIATTASVQVTTSANTLCCGVATYPALNPATPNVPDAITTSTSTGSPLGLDVNIVAGGAAIGAVQVRDTSATSGGAWSGLTETVDSDIRSTEYFTVAGGGSAGSPAPITVTRTGAGTDSRAVSASVH